MSTVRASLQDVVAAVTSANEAIARFWSSVHGWAPPNAAHLLQRSRLDRQVSLSRTLVLWIPPALHATCEDKEGELILAWANLGALVEGTIKWFASVFYADYLKDANVIVRKGAIRDPDEAGFDELREFFRKSVWLPSDDEDAWILQVQQRRNAIHAYHDRDLGTFQEFHESLRHYLSFLGKLNSRAPYPDGHR